jgi:hypothetical protein
MRKLPVLQNDSDSTRNLRHRIALSNRPRMGVGLKRLDDVSSSLAKNNQNRTRFVQNPAAYLQAQSLPVSSCNLVQGSLAQTTEACTVNLFCAVTIFAAVISVTGSLALTVAVAITQVRVAGTEVDEVARGVDGYNYGNPTFMGTAI